MSRSRQLITRSQIRWAGKRARDPQRPNYLRSLAENLFLDQLRQKTEQEFLRGDGSELNDSGSRPAKMRSLVSSSAMAVNFFDCWGDGGKESLSQALGMAAPITDFEFEFKTRGYPVGPRSPNLDLLLRLEDGRCFGVESKFTEPYCSTDGHGALSARYFPAGHSLWAEAALAGAQRLASGMQPDWIHLDAPQLLKHLLGLACDTARPAGLLYLWYDTGEADAVLHRKEIERFSEAVAGDVVEFRAETYQRVFGQLDVAGTGVDSWREYMRNRYFGDNKSS